MTYKTPLTHAKSHLIAATILGLGLMALSACSSAPARDADIFYDLRPEIADVTFGSNKIVKVQSVSIKGLQPGRPIGHPAVSSAHEGWGRRRRVAARLVKIVQQPRCMGLHLRRRAMRTT